ncbi:MAG: hypothetical protein OXI15_14515 [Chromatiales bacterium]|nr:hypothetical protein [Chromatiales bacterium]
MSALSHFLETEGLATTGICLVREHAETMAPPRSLWVPFPLGRPLGAAADPAFQHRVIAAALALLDRPRGPVLEDFPETAPEDGIDTPWSCPVRFARTAAGRNLARSVRAELAGLATWHELAIRRRGRTAAVTSGLGVEQCLELVIDAGRTGHAGDVRTLKAAVEDLKIYYVEATTAQPGTPPAGAVDEMLWNESALGRLLRRLAARGSDSRDPAMKFFANDSLIPRRFR